MKPVLQQAGVIPFRYCGGDLQVLLITSRGSGRWVIPKGGIEKGFSPAQAAAQEAYEEAGVKGALSATPLGSFVYHKRLRHGAIMPANVEVYAMRVEEALKNWPERAQRRLKWLPVAEAIRLVDNKSLAVLLSRLEHTQQAIASAA